MPGVAHRRAAKALAGEGAGEALLGPERMNLIHPCTGTTQPRGALGQIGHGREQRPGIQSALRSSEVRHHVQAGHLGSDQRQLFSKGVLARVTTDMQEDHITRVFLLVQVTGELPLPALSNRIFPGRLLDAGSTNSPSA